MEGNGRQYRVMPPPAGGPPPPFNPNDYPGLMGYWLADDGQFAFGQFPPFQLIDVPTHTGPAAALDPLGSTIFSSFWTGASGGVSLAFDNATAKVLLSAAGFGAATDWTSFIVFKPTSDVPVADVQYLQFIGDWTNGDLTGQSYLNSFGDGAAYRQGVGFAATYAPATPGPQVFCLKYRNGPAPRFNVYRDGILILSADFAPAASTRLAVCGLEIGGGIIGPGFSLNGDWKTSLHYEGAALTQLQIDEINANLFAIHC